MPSASKAFHRNELLLGRKTVSALARTRVLLFGVGGVGGWCAEALIRAGIGRLTLVDFDVVAESNLNRQLAATVPDLGRPKAEVLRERLRRIRPEAEVVALQKRYDETTEAEFDFSAYDFIIDAIDELSPKTALIARAMASDATLFSSMGAARKRNAGAVRTGSVWTTRHCRLARFVRKRLRRRGATGDFVCVYSEEPPMPAEPVPEGEAAPPNGSMVHVVGTFGFRLAELVVEEVARRCPHDTEKKP